MQRNQPMKRVAYWVYGLVCYASFVGAILYAIGFVGNFWQVLGWEGSVFRGMDSGPRVPSAEALAVDAAVLAVFAVQHSVMARRGFKRWWTRIVPPALERSTFVVAASLSLALLYWQWRPLGSIVWEAPAGAPSFLLVAASLAGWLTVLLATFMIDHFELFGLRQVAAAFSDRPQASKGFATPALYRLVRHPIYLGLLIAFWATPVMTVGHLVFAIGTTGYILLGIQLEERDLVASYGEAYRAYRRRVRMLLPVPVPKRPGDEVVHGDAIDPPSRHAR